MRAPLPTLVLVTVGLLAASCALTSAAPAEDARARALFAQAEDPRPTGEIDRVAFAGLAARGVAPAPRCTDAVFVRRVFLDAIGTLPTAKEARDFIGDSREDKRQRLIDALLRRPEFADYWTMRWCDALRVKAEFPINLWPNAAQAYHRWIYTAVRDNLPYDQFARALLTASGSNFRAGSANFYRATQGREPRALARTVALTFLGARLDRWSENDIATLARFFSAVAYKPTQEWKEEIVFFDPAKSPPPSPVARQNREAGYPWPDDVAIGPAQDPREAFADWLLERENPWLARAAANRLWAWVFGRGIVHPADDIRPDNPPADAALLATLSRRLVASGYDLKALLRDILQSHTYQQSSLPATDAAAADPLASYPWRRLDAEVLIDALNQVTGASERYVSAIPEPFTVIPENVRSIALPDGSITSAFLELFGRPARDTGEMAERASELTAAQRLHLLNSSHIQAKIEQGPRLQALLRSSPGAEPAISEIYLTVLSRPPEADEVAAAAAHAASVGARPGAIDLVWALINSAEFLYRH